MRRRDAYTLVEILVVITILGILVGLLVPAVAGTVRRANVARVEAQVNTTAAALASFKSKYGHYPPSRLVWHESGYIGTPPAAGPDATRGRYFAGMGGTHAPIGGSDLGPAAGSTEFAALVARSVASLRTIFPKLRTESRSWPGGRGLNPDPSEPDGKYDTNANGTLDNLPVLLDGSECLVLFLAGLPYWNGPELVGTIGLGGDPRNPLGPGEPRTEPFLDLDASRLADDDGDGMPGLLDTLGTGSEARYLAYFSSELGGYDPRDCQWEPDSVGAFTLPGVGPVSSPGPNPWSPGGNAWARPKSFQLLSPGLDRKYGPGGVVREVNGDRQFPGTGREVEADNVGMR